MKTLVCILLIVLAAWGQSWGQASAWGTKKLKDAFGDPTGEVAIIGLFKGTFNTILSNTVPDSAVTVMITWDIVRGFIVNGKKERDRIQFTTKFFKHNRYPAAFLYARETAPPRLVIKLSDGTVEVIEQSVFGDYLMDDDLVFYNLVLSQDKPFRIIVVANESEYKYKIDPAGFKELVKQYGSVNK